MVVRVLSVGDLLGHPRGIERQVASVLLEALEGGGRWSVGGHELELTNLDKVLFPDAGFTKRDDLAFFLDRIVGDNWKETPPGDPSGPAAAG